MILVLINIIVDFLRDIFEMNIPIKGYRLDSYFRSAAALSVVPPPLAVNLAACEGLEGGSGKSRNFYAYCLKILGNHPDLKILGIFGITRIEV